MKSARVLARIALLSLAAALFIGLTQIYAGSMRPPRFSARYGRARRNNRPSEPQAGRFLSFLGEGMVVALIAVAGRIVFRLRLAPAARSEDQVILLDLGGDQ
jgi:hypothetical protein